MGSKLLHEKISNVSSLLKTKQITASELCNLSLRRINRTEKLNAFATVNPDAATAAENSDSRRKDGKSLGLLDGIPVAVKDNFCTKDLRTTCASKMLQNYVPPYTATVVDKLLLAGAVMIGKTNMDEYAMGTACVHSIFGPAVNPWKAGSLLNADEKAKAETDWYISGGSSGGSAVAVATGSCYAALASDTGGSTRNPASRVGVVGLKPTYGILSRYGLIPLTHSMDVPGILSRHVDDVALVLQTICGFDERDSTTTRIEFEKEIRPPDVSKITVGIPKEYNCEGLSPDIADLWKNVADNFSNLGAKVVDVSLPHTRYAISCYSVLNSCEVASNLACYDGVEYGHRATHSETSTEEMYAASRTEAFGDIVKARILTGTYFSLRKNYELYYNQALRVRRLIAQDFDNVFAKGVDVLLTPVTLTAAPKYSEWVQGDNTKQILEEDYCTQPANIVGLPAVAVPCKLSSNGLPISIQLMAPRLKDFFLLSCAKLVEDMFQFQNLLFEKIKYDK